MGRVVVTIIVVGGIAGAIFYYNYRNQQTIMQMQHQQIQQLQDQAASLQKQNDDLKQQLAKVQSEQDRLAAENDTLNKAIAQYKATGKMPALKLPYPPK
jgi:peptidoglycan hydrolase CwlO-like protein